jgi:hypothetical protein
MRGRNGYGDSAERQGRMITDPLIPAGAIHHVHVTRQEGPQYSSSITIGTPGKGGECKVDIDPDDPEGTEHRVREASGCGISIIGSYKV